MKLTELKEKIDTYIEHGHGDDIVVIHLSQISIGGIAKAGVTGFYPGFDWDNGYMIVESDRPIIEREHERDIPKAIIKRECESNPRKIKYYSCPSCNNIIKKERYCSCCGQRLVQEEE